MITKVIGKDGEGENGNNCGKEGQKVESLEPIIMSELMSGILLCGK